MAYDTTNQMKQNYADQLRNQLIGVQLDSARDYDKRLPGIIDAEVRAKQKEVGAQASQARSQFLQDMNRRGMVHSGQKRLGEAKLERNRAKVMNDEIGNIITTQMNKRDAMYVDPLNSATSRNADKTNFNAQVDEINRARDSFNAQMRADAYGYFGNAAGTGMANVNANRNFFNNPKTKTSAY